MGDFQPLARSGECHRVLAHDVARPHHRKTDAAGAAWGSRTWLSKTATSLKVTPRDLAMVSPKFKAVPDGASRFCR